MQGRIVRRCSSGGRTLSADRSGAETAKRETLRGISFDPNIFESKDESEPTSLRLIPVTHLLDQETACVGDGIGPIIVLHIIGLAYLCDEHAISFH